MSRVFDVIARQAAVPATEVTVVLTDDFIADVKRYSTSDVNQTYSDQRVGGIAMAKNLPQAVNYSSVTIVFSASLWRDAAADDQIPQITAVAHEFAHPLLIRARYESRAKNTIKVSAQTAAEQFRASARAAWDEYRADLLAYNLLTTVASKTVDGATSAIEVADIISPNYLPELANVLDSLHPAWPLIIEDFRNWRLDVTALWDEVLPRVDQAFTWFAHVQATAVGAGIDRIWESPELRALPATRLYVRDHWIPFADVIRQFEVLPPVSKLADIETTVMDAGERAFRGILAELGMKVYDRSDGTYYVDVQAPNY